MRNKLETMKHLLDQLNSQKCIKSRLLNVLQNETNRCLCCAHSSDRPIVQAHRPIVQHDRGIAQLCTHRPMVARLDNAQIIDQSLECDYQILQLIS